VLLFFASLTFFFFFFFFFCSFITWPEENRVSDAIYLAMAMQRQHPHIKLFVRTFDDQLREVLESFGAKVFSTSSYAFNMLQREVSKDSNLSHATSVQ